jgi:glycosyltransferase involved in cell wall biosynthesis
MLGFLANNPAVQRQEDYVRRHTRKGIELHPFQPPQKYFLKSKFFVLPADIVYLNFALLEAMAHGVVPIVSDVEGARNIVEDGVSGLVAPHSREGLLRAMTRAKHLTKNDYECISANARLRVINQFSIDSWAKKLRSFYHSLDAV